MESGYMELPPLPREVRPLTTNEGERLDSLYGTRFRVANCLTCGGGDRLFKWWADPFDRDPDKIATYRCSCEAQWILYRYLLNAGVGVNYMRLGMADMHVEPAATAFFLDYMENLSWNMGRGMGMFLHGSHGSGKTLMSYLAIKALLAQGVDCYATTFAGMLDAFAATWRSDEERRWYWRRVRNAGVLLIDDVGREQFEARGKEGMIHKSVSFAQPQLEETVRHRINASLPTFITSNMDPATVGVQYGSNFLSLLSESAHHMRFEGADYRPQHRAEREVEMRLGLSAPVVLR